MQTQDYEKFVASTAIYTPNHGTKDGMIYTAVALSGETGELLNKLKKILRGDSNVQELLDGMILELGDVLWYCTALAKELGVTLEEVMQKNMDKLTKRKAIDAIKGSGDSR